jgi:hypothetical protein
MRQARSNGTGTVTVRNELINFLVMVSMLREQVESLV